MIAIEPLAGKGPIDVRLQKVSETAVLDMLRQPVDAAVVRQHLFLEGGRADEPAFSRILDQRILFGPPAERIIVQILLLMEEQALGFQVADDVAVGLFDPAAFEFGRFVGERAVGSDGANERRALRLRRIWLVRFAADRNRLRRTPELDGRCPSRYRR